MAITRGQLLKQLVPGLHAIFGTEYKRYEDEAAILFENEKSNRAFEEEVLFITIAIGSALGFLGAWFAVEKHLQSIEL